MNEAITKGIKISVQPRYMADESRPSQGRYVFSYTILIENLSDSTTQLLSRHWYILDSLSAMREVTGDGVIGRQPIIQPGETHNYTSWCPLRADIGLMFGHFTMKNLDTETTFDVRIPAFTMITDAKLN